MRLFGIRTLFSVIVGFAVSALFMIVNVFKEVFSFEAALPVNRADTANTELADRQSQTGKGVWAFVTDLFGVEGRQYCWQAGTIA